jgi:hypothetical protein
MKTKPGMNDAQRIAAWETVTSPFEALEELAEHQTFVGTDPYYRDLDGALWGMVRRVLALGDPVERLRTSWHVRDLTSDDFTNPPEAAQ